MVDHVISQPVPTAPPATAEERAAAFQMERYKANLAEWVASRDIGPMAAQLTSLSRLGLQSLLIVNAGGLLAILSLLSAAWDKPGTSELAHRLQPSAELLVSGLVLVFLAIGLGYATQVLSIEKRDSIGGRRIAYVGQGFSFILSGASLACFAWGVLSGVSAISNAPHPSRPAQPAAWSTNQQGEP